MQISEKIKEYRKIYNLTQEQLAIKLNVSRQVITKWENNDGLPDIGNLKAISKLFEISVDYLLDDDKNLEYPLVRRCLRCNVEMIENFDIKVEATGYGIKLTEQGIFKDNLGKFKCSVCPCCGYTEVYIDDTEKLKKLLSKRK